MAPPDTIRSFRRGDQVKEADWSPMAGGDSVVEPPGRGSGLEFSKEGDLAALKGCGRPPDRREIGPLAPGQKSPSPFPPLPPWEFSGGGVGGLLPPISTPLSGGGSSCHIAVDEAAVRSMSKKKGLRALVGCRVLELGSEVLNGLLEVFPLRSPTMGRRNSTDIFPLPTSKEILGELFPHFDDSCIFWMMAICVSLNCLWGGDAHSIEKPNRVASECLVLLGREVARLQYMTGKLENFSWDNFFSTRGIDYKGDEVKTARTFTWDNIRHALPAEIGRVPLEDVCTRGAQHYVLNFDSFIKDRAAWVLKKAPRVMVANEHWAEVCAGLVEAGVCTMLPVEEVFDTGQGPLLNGLFGVSKEEWVGETEVLRLIMNLIPLNNIAHPLKGDVETLPMWSMMNPFFLQPGEHLLISSEDVRCFFYTMAVPCTWYKYLAFNRAVPAQCLPPHLQGREVYLAAKVLPMGFLNSVSLAQHVHRNLTLWSGRVAQEGEIVNPPELEIRKDRPLTVGNPSWRIYLDNYDLLEKAEAAGIGGLEGSLAPSVLALRQEYERWEIPRNMKKSVSRQLRAEVQGAQVDGELGVVYPRESKLLKYLAATLSLVQEDFVSQKQMQVVCGGLVYISMFRRPLLGCLNSVWSFIESFNQEGPSVKRFPPQCKSEILRLIGLLPLARLDFRVPFHEQVTCSDASSSGGGICASAGCTPLGHYVSKGQLRGELPELRHDHQILTIGLFDGIGALRVAVDLLGLQVIGHISVEANPHAQRVVESHFPEAILVSDVKQVSSTMVREWARLYSQASVVVIGAGPPCQGVSGLNCDRKGALRDERSSLFSHVPRVSALAKEAFPWCQVHTLMESVASMDKADRDIMSTAFGERPWKCDAGTLSWCSRPRLYWLTWEVCDMEGATLDASQDPQCILLEACQDLEMVCQEGWIKVDPDRPCPTFTTSRPRTSPGRKPAGIHSCTSEEVGRWEKDQFRYSPYQYANRNLLINRRNELQLPSIEEKEFMMGFPVHYTINSVEKKHRGSVSHMDIRHSLIGNSWSVPVIAWVLAQLFGRLGLCPLYTPQQLMDLLSPTGQVFLQSRLWRRPLRPMRVQEVSGEPPLVHKLSNLISIKGEDILLTTPSSQLCKYHRLRASVPARLWKWRVVAGWKWSSKEHINSLELRATLTALKWRVQYRGQLRHRFLHLVDSLVVLHCLARGRSSSKKLRSSLSRINALLLCSSSQALWGYVHTEQNPPTSQVGGAAS